MPRSPRPKNVVYLWGAGATQAELSYQSTPGVNLLMRDSDELGLGVASRILGRLSPRMQRRFSSPSADIEKLISLLSATSAASHQRLADKIRRLYFEEICRTLAGTGVIQNPSLAIGLFTLHANTHFNRAERLTGILTTNHDGLLQLAASKVYDEVNLGIPFESSDIRPSSAQPPILQLHGSFTWLFGLPIRVALLGATTAYSTNAVWIPPAISKEFKGYPFGKILAAGYELLTKQCDVLRVVGSSMTQNDWNVLSLLFTAQRHQELRGIPPFRIELVMPHKDGTQITQTCSYLRHLVPIGFLTDGEFAPYKEDVVSSEMNNPLAYWIRQKLQFHDQRGDLGPRPLAPALATLVGDQP